MLVRVGFWNKEVWSPELVWGVARGPSFQSCFSWCWFCPQVGFFWMVIKMFPQQPQSLWPQKEERHSIRWDLPVLYACPLTSHYKTWEMTSSVLIGSHFHSYGEGWNSDWLTLQVVEERFLDEKGGFFCWKMAGLLYMQK